LEHFNQGYEERCPYFNIPFSIPSNSFIFTFYQKIFIDLDSPLPIVPQQFIDIAQHLFKATLSDLLVLLSVL
jgi:hypothetical protein